MYVGTGEFAWADLCDMDLCSSGGGGRVLVICDYTGGSGGHGRGLWWAGGGVGGQRMVGGVVGERVEMIHCVSSIGSMDNEE